MTQLLEKVFTKMGKLSAVDQNALAKWILKELSAERKWDKAFAESEWALEKLAGEALSESKKGKTKLLNFGSL